MNGIEMDPKAMSVAGSLLSDDAPCFMLNLLRYREQADYGDAGVAAAATGREVYFTRYIPTFVRLAGPDVTPLWAGIAAVALVAPADERWDTAAVVRYPSFRTFRDLVESDAYRTEALPHRLAALADWRLIACTDLPIARAIAGEDY